MREPIRIFDSFEAADRADDEYYASLTPKERLDILLDLIASYQELLGDTAKRLERVHRVVELAES
jgi:hypothetical protein